MVLRSRVFVQLPTLVQGFRVGGTCVSGGRYDVAQRLLLQWGVDGVCCIVEEPIFL